MKLLCAERALFSTVECQENDVYGAHRHGAVRVGLEATVSVLENHSTSRRFEVILTMAGDGNSAVLPANTHCT